MSALSDRLRRRIGERGAVVFAEVMEDALYGEGGYYNRSELAIGEAGDFVTGSTLSDLFGRSTARLLSRLDGPLERSARLLEVGYGDGRHLAAVAAAAGPGRVLLGWDRVARPLPAGVERLNALDDLKQPIEGLVFSYELFDALPVHRLIGRADGSVGELRVDLDSEGSFVWRDGALSDPALTQLLGDHSLESGQIADLSTDWGPLYSRLAATLGRGLLVTFDYGYERRQLLDVRVRRHGTLACYRSQSVHRDALRDLGEQDLTAHVDFTALREAGEAAGLQTMALTRQARWLAELGLFEDLAETAHLGIRQQAATLLDPNGMGDQIRVLVQSRNLDASRVLDLAILGSVAREAPPRRSTLGC